MPSIAGNIAAADPTIRRIAIIGCAGAGKSTFARRLAPLAGLPLIHLDREFWQPGWVLTERPRRLAMTQDFVAAPEWILDGNYMSTMSLRVNAADLVIFFDLPRWLCLWRIVKRRAQYRGRSRPDLGPGCPEQLDWDFVRWVWSFPAVLRPHVLARLADAPVGTRIVTFRVSEAAESFLAAVAEIGLHAAMCHVIMPINCQR